MDWTLDCRTAKMHVNRGQSRRETLITQRWCSAGKSLEIICVSQTQVSLQTKWHSNQKLCFVVSIQLWTKYSSIKIKRPEFHWYEIRIGVKYKPGSEILDCHLWVVQSGRLKRLRVTRSKKLNDPRRTRKAICFAVKPNWSDTRWLHHVIKACTTTCYKM